MNPTNATCYHWGLGKLKIAGASISSLVTWRIKSKLPKRLSWELYNIIFVNCLVWYLYVCPLYLYKSIVPQHKVHTCICNIACTQCKLIILLLIRKTICNKFSIRDFSFMFPLMTKTKINYITLRNLMLFSFRKHSFYPCYQYYIYNICIKFLFIAEGK